jgi:hypothetical protein
VPLTTPFDFNRDGKPDLTVAEVLAKAEAVRLNPASTKDQLDTARDQLDRVEGFSTN